MRDQGFYPVFEVWSCDTSSTLVRSCHNGTAQVDWSTHHDGLLGRANREEIAFQ
jgi:hypothetical protein